MTSDGKDPPTFTFDEYAWSDAAGATGGGASAAYPTPSWQTAAGIAQIKDSNGDQTAGQRFVPDIAGMVYMGTGSSTGDTFYVNGVPIGGAGGTSASTPLYAGLWALLQNIFGVRLGFPNAILYSLANSVVRTDITFGNNDPDDGSNAPYYNADPTYNGHAGWNPCTGWG